MSPTRSDRLVRAIGYADRLAAGETPDAVVEHVADAVLITDIWLEQPGPAITFANAAFERQTGYDRGELVGRSPRMLQGFDTDLLELARMRAALEAGGYFEGAVLNYRKSGLEYVIGWAIAPLRTEDGGIAQWLSVQSDVMADSRAARSAP